MPHQGETLRDFVRRHHPDLTEDRIGAELRVWTELALSRDNPARHPGRYTGPPITLANMRANGVRSLIVTCPACHRDVVFDAEAYADDVSMCGP